MVFVHFWLCFHFQCTLSFFARDPTVWRLSLWIVSTYVLKFVLLVSRRLASISFSYRDLSVYLLIVHLLVVIWLLLVLHFRFTISVHVRHRMWWRTTYHGPANKHIQFEHLRVVIHNQTWEYVLSLHLCTCTRGYHECRQGLFLVLATDATYIHTTLNFLNVYSQYPLDLSLSNIRLSDPGPLVFHNTKSILLCSLAEFYFHGNGVESVVLLLQWCVVRKSWRSVIPSRALIRCPLYHSGR